MNLSRAQNIPNMCVLLTQAHSSLGVGIMGTPLAFAKELLSQPAAMPSRCLRNLSSVATPYNCYTFPFLPFVPTIQLETTLALEWSLCRRLGTRRMSLFLSRLYGECACSRLVLLFRAPLIPNSTSQYLQRFSPLQHLGQKRVAYHDL